MYIPLIPGKPTVNINNSAFSPASLIINKGDTVTWINQDSAPHTATGVSFDSKTIDEGHSYSFTFIESGPFKYKCTFHPSMLGEVIVK